MPTETQLFVDVCFQRLYPLDGAPDAYVKEWMGWSLMIARKNVRWIGTAYHRNSKASLRVDNGQTREHAAGLLQNRIIAQREALALFGDAGVPHD